jgi:TonB family protein
MRNRDITWTVALCLSLAIHTAIIRWRADAYVNANSPLRLAGFSREWIAQSILQTPPDDEGLLGDDKGIGSATDAAPGDLPLLARKGDQDQSYLSRDPQSMGQTGAQPRQSLTPPGENGANGSQTAQDQVAQQSSNHPFGLREQQQASPAFQPPTNHQPGPAPSPKATRTRAQTAVAQSAASPVSVTAYSAPSGRPGPIAATASPAPQGDSDSDPFAVVGSMDLRPGSTKIQCGRKHRITHPRLPWDAVYDFQEMTSVSVTLELQLDETGQVISAVVIKSSGSSSIDQPCRLAAYSWWFEPAKDSNGKPIKDVIKFTCKFM